MRSEVILAIIFAGIVFYGCTHKGIRQDKIGDLEKVCSDWKHACELGDCSKYVFSCLDDSIAGSEKFIDQDLLAKIIAEYRSVEVRVAATGKLTDQTLLTKIAVKDGSSEVRAAAVRKLNDQVLLSRIARSDSHEWVRRTATEKLTDQTVLAKIVLEAKETHVRLAAVENITNQALLAKIALEANHSNVREYAVKNLSSQALLTKIAVEDEDITIRSMAANKLIDLAKAGNTYTNKYPEKLSPADFSIMITDTAEGEAAAWESSGTEGLSKNKEIVSGCGNDYCEQNESHSRCPADCFPVDIKPTDLSEGDKAVYLDFVYKGQKSGIFFVVNRDVHERLASLPRSLSHNKGKERITKKDFILPNLNNQLQKEKLLPLVKKIESLTPDVNKQARIAISLVQNIPYGYTTTSDAEISFVKKYPYGVIWEQIGICDEKSDLLLFLLSELGLGTAALIYKNENHRAVGVKCPAPYDVGDSGYCYVEVTTPKIITDNLPAYMGVGALTDFKVIDISDGIQLGGVEEEFTDKILYYDLIYKTKANNGALEQNEYDMYNSILKKYGME